MKTMHLFAGAGGGILADLILGHEPIIAVEWEPYACQVLRERTEEGWFPNMQVWEGDVRLFDPSEYKGRVDCIHAGFPCQDISVAGNQAGVGEDTRSGLYREVLRIADVVRPEYLFLENVSAIISNGLDRVLADLAERGYNVIWKCLSASEVGANHKRDRWWLLAYPIEQRCDLRVDNIREGYIQDNKKRNTEKIQQQRNERIARAREVGAVFPDPNSPHEQRDELSEREGKGYTEHSKHGWWESESDVCRVADGVASWSHRLKALGNGQVPIQAAVAFSILWKMMEEIKEGT